MSDYKYLEIMKINRFTYILAATVLIASCEIIPSQVSPVSSDDLQRYADELFAHNVILPVEMAEFAVDFNRYLAMSDEEKVGDYRFYGKIDMVGENIYHINDGRISCTLNTGGMSIDDENASWQYLTFSVTSHVLSQYRPVLYMNVENEALLTFAPVEGEGRGLLDVSIVMEDDEAGLVLQSYEDGDFEWEMACFGEDRGSGGLRAEYSTGLGTGGFKISARKVANEDYNEFICLGQFNVNIYEGTKEVDWCRIIYNAGYAPMYQTSR